MSMVEPGTGYVERELLEVVEKHKPWKKLDCFDIYRYQGPAFRNDFNGRPQIFCYGDDNELRILRTHPFYCFDGSHYGRVYRLIDMGSTDFDCHIYDIHVYRLLDEHILHHIIHASEAHFTVCNLNFDRVDTPYSTLVREMNGQFPKEHVGALRNGNDTWLISVDEQDEQNGSFYELDYQDVIGGPGPKDDIAEKEEQELRKRMHNAHLPGHVLHVQGNRVWEIGSAETMDTGPIIYTIRK